MTNLDREVSGGYVPRTSGPAAQIRLFALVSSAGGHGSGCTEADMLPRHLAYGLDVLETTPPHRQPRFELPVFGYPVLTERLAGAICPARAGRPVPVAGQPGRGYYTMSALPVTARQGGTELGDGGFTTWTGRLTHEARERGLVSCIATGRLASLIRASGRNGRWR